MSSDEAARARARAAIDALESDLRAAFGWADIGIAVEIADDGVVVLVGEVVAPRVRTRVVEALAVALPDRRIDASGIGLRRGPWHALPAGTTELWRRAGLARELATELVPSDGPVERIADVCGATLVRAPDGTLGWTAHALGPAVAAPLFGRDGPFAREALAEIPARWLDVPYRLGGTTTRGVDCSGLVQRALADIGMRVPRHSGDQLAIAPREAEGADELGALVLVWARDEAPCHVGVALGDGRIVHASRSRARVVVDARTELLARASRVAHVRWDDLVELQERARGCTSLVEVLAIGSDR